MMTCERGGKFKVFIVSVLQKTGVFEKVLMVRVKCESWMDEVK